MNEYRVKVSVTNNLLLNAIENVGFKNQAEFARNFDISPQALNALIGLRVPPINKGGSFSELANKVMEALGAIPTELWTEEQLTMALPKSSSTGTLDIKQLTQLQNRMTVNEIEYDPSEKLDQSLIAKKVQEVLEGLTTKERKILTLRYGMDGCEEHTLEEVAKIFDLTRERIRQIEGKALRKLYTKQRLGEVELIGLFA